jgi:hypothetical protein
MLRTLMVGVAVLLLLSSAVQGHQGDTVLLDKKDALTKSDPGYQPDLKNLSPKVKNDAKLLAFISGNPHKVYTIKLKKGDKITITLKSIPPANPNNQTGIDTVVLVEDAKKIVLDLNDDDPTDLKTLDSRLIFTAPEDGEYRVIATTMTAVISNKTGEFQIKITK